MSSYDDRSTEGPPPKRIGSSLDEVLRRMGAPPASSVDRIFSGWSELVGERVAAHVTPVSVEKGRLLVAVDSPAWATEFKYQQAKLLRKLDDEVGEGVVKRVEVRVQRPSSGGREA